MIDPQQILHEGISLLMKVGSPVLLTVLVIGLIVSIFQALTQVQEQTLSFIPKLFSVILCLWIMQNFISSTFLAFSNRIFDAIALK